MTITGNGIMVIGAFCVGLTVGLITMSFVTMKYARLLENTNIVIHYILQAIHTHNNIETAANSSKYYNKEYGNNRYNNRYGSADYYPQDRSDESEAIIEELRTNG